MTLEIEQPGALGAEADASARAEHIARLLAATPGQENHKACGVTARPCGDCRQTAPLECVDPGWCGRNELCRPCAATWRCRMWRAHLLHVRAFHCALERYPALAGIHSDQATAAAIFWELRRAIRRDAIKWLRRHLGKLRK